MDYRILTQSPDENLRAAWDEFLAHASFPTHYVTPGFFTDPFIRGGLPFAVLAMEGERIDAVLTAVDAGDAVVSGFAVRPQTAFRKNIDTGNAAKALLDGVKEKGGGGLSRIEFYAWENIAGHDGELCAGSDEVVVLDLARGAAELFKDFSQTRRNELRKSIKQNLLTVREPESEAELAELYEIHKSWNAGKGTEPDRWKDFFAAAEDKKYRKILIALYEGKIVAGSFYRFCSGGVVEYAGNNSLPEFQKLRPNDLIGWRAIEWTCAAGFTHFSMGGSHLFLRRFGGRIQPVYRYRQDLTFLKIHEKKAKLKQLVVNTYMSLPQFARRRVKQVLGKNS